MPEPESGAFTVATSSVIADTIRSARRRLVVVAPALSAPEAEAVCDRIAVLQPDAIALVFDSSPEVFRLGYGDIESQQRVQTAAGAHHIQPRWQPGIRIGVVIADDETLVFTPTPCLIEAGPNTSGGANAIRLGSPPRTVAADLGIDGADAPRVGKAPLTADQVDEVKTELKANPPQKFDVARRVLVFNSFIEFVEIEVRGTELSRRTFRIPPFLLAVADKAVKQQLRTTFSLLPDDDFSGAAIERDRRLLTSKYLRVIPRYGTVVLRRDKDALVNALNKLEGLVKGFGAKAQATVQSQIDKTVAELSVSLLPVLIARPPSEWTLSSGQALDETEMGERLQDELRAAFGSASDLAAGMSVHHRFKGVTHEMLTDSAFLEAAIKAIPEVERLHVEFDAAAAKSS